jgi:site-specific recombinase XerD
MTARGFLNYLKVERGLATFTISAYAHDLKAFSSDLRKRSVSLVYATREDIRHHLGMLERDGLRCTDSSTALKLLAPSL